MLEVKPVDIYVDGELAVEAVTLNYEAFDLESTEPQCVTAAGFLPCTAAFTQDKFLVIDFKNGIYAKAKIIASMRLCDEYQCEMRVVDASRSLEELLANDGVGPEHEELSADVS